MYYLSFEGVRHREGRCDPAECVDHMSWDTIDDALYRMTHVLASGDHQAASHQQRCGEEVVHPEDRTINGDLLEFEVGPQPSQ